MSKFGHLGSRLSKAPARTFSSFAASTRVRGSQWMRLRAVVLRDACGLCQCEACVILPLEVRPEATEVDHVVAIADGGHPTARDNLQAINEDCHKRKTAAEDAARAGRVRPATDLLTSLPGRRR